MAKLIGLPDADSDTVLWINPDAVALVVQADEDRVLIRFIDDPLKTRVWVKGEADRVAAKLNSVKQREPV